MTDQPDPGCPGTRTHGTASAYDHARCRCAAARDAATRYRAERRARRANPGAPAAMVAAAGTHRRIGALLAAGWTTSMLAAELGTHAYVLANRRRRRFVSAATADRVVLMFDALSARRAGHPAAAVDDDDGWVEPAGPDTEPDPVAVARLFGSGPVPSPLAVVDAVAFASAATSAGWSAERIAGRVGVSSRQVQRWRHLARVGVPETRVCEWCDRPIVFDPAEQPWRYRQRRFHVGVCLAEARSAAAVRYEAGKAAAARAASGGGVGVAS